MITDMYTVHTNTGIGGFEEGQGGPYYKGTEISFTETLTNFLLFYAL